MSMPRTGYCVTATRIAYLKFQWLTWYFTAPHVSRIVRSYGVQRFIWFDSYGVFYGFKAYGVFSDFMAYSVFYGCDLHVVFYCPEA